MPFALTLRTDSGFVKENPMHVRHRAVNPRSRGTKHDTALGRFCTRGPHRPAREGVPR
jgi:hypothetical protein